MRDTRELVLARPTRWRCSPDLESERGGHSAAQPDLLPHPVRIVAVRAACRGIERVNRFVCNKLLDAVDLPTNGKHRAEGQHIVLRLIAVAVMRVRIDPQARHARAAHCIGQAGLRVSDEVKLLAGVKAGFGDGERSEEHTSELQSLMRISYAVFCLKKT